MRKLTGGVREAVLVLLIGWGLSALACSAPLLIPASDTGASASAAQSAEDFYRGVYSSCMFAFVTKGGYGRESAAIICNGMLDDAIAAEIHIGDPYGWSWEPGQEAAP